MLMTPFNVSKINVIPTASGGRDAVVRKIRVHTIEKIGTGGKAGRIRSTALETG
jgi:hypothetical protein